MNYLKHHNTCPANPKQGDMYYDYQIGFVRVYNGTQWITSGTTNSSGTAPSTIEPTEAELERYPALKESWNEYLIIRKLLGLHTII